MASSTEVKPKAKKENLEGSTVNESLLSYARRAMYKYGAYTNEDRAIPDYRDGMKPVFRRAIWSLKSMAKNQWVKTAKVVGHCIGSYHPHGDTGVNGAIGTLVNSSLSPIAGKGNWGTVIDGAAAARYTNIQLSKYGQLLLKPEYLAVSDYVPNYDNTEKEPVILPALLPNLLLNGNEGIGVGLVSSIPSYTLESVLEVLVALLERKELGPKDYAKILKFKFPWGGHFVNTAENRKALVEFYSSHQGAIKFGCKLDEVSRGVFRWADFAPNVSVLKVVERMRAVVGVDKVLNTTDREGVSFTIRLKKSLTETQYDVAARRIKAMLSTTKNFKVNVTERTKREDEVDVKLFSASVPILFKMWLKWRVGLEAKSLDNRIVQQTAAILYTKLLMHAIDNLEVVISALRKDDPAEFLAKALKITLEDANRILDLKVRQLSKLDREKLTARLKDETVGLRDLETWRKKPSRKVLKELVLLQSRLHLVAKTRG